MSLSRFCTNTLSIFCFVGVLLVPTAAQAGFTLQSTLEGDFRTGRPDNIFLDVTVVVSDSTPNIATFTVDLNSVLHSSARLDEFAFNLNYGAGNVVEFQNFSPYSSTSRDHWQEVSRSNLRGSGDAEFDFYVGKDGDPDVTNSVPLSFELVLKDSGGNAVNFTESMFLTAKTSSGDAELGTFQLGAHVLSLTGGESGVAVGTYGITAVPEPSTVVLATLGLMGFCGYRSLRRKNRKTEENSAV